MSPSLDDASSLKGLRYAGFGVGPLDCASSSSWQRLNFEEIEPVM
jgi:hypothetical protein